MKYQRAFSLLELSAVITIIGVLTASLVAGNSIIRNSRLATARTLTQNSPVGKIPGLISWHETSMKESFSINQALDGAQITAWYDISPASIVAQRNVLTATASNSVLYESSGINKLPSVKFNGTGTISLASHYQDFSNVSTLFLVFRPLVSNGNTYTVFDGGVGNGKRSISYKNTGIALFTTQWGFTGTGTYPANVYAGGNYIVAGHYNDTSSCVYFNSITNKAGNGNVSPGTYYGTTGMVVGANGASNYKFSGLISEIIIYNRILNANERRDVMIYLSKKYGITLT